MKIKEAFNKVYAPAAAAVAMIPTYAGIACAEGELFTVPTLITADIVALMGSVTAGLAVMWGARKVIKTMNRS